MPRKLKNGQWQVDVTVGYTADGRRDRRQRRFLTKAEAVSFEREMLVLKDPHLVSGKITLSDFIDDVYWPNKATLSPNTILGYKRDIKLRILPYLGGKNIEDISRYDIQQMISACPTRKAATNARETLSSILGLAVDLEMLMRNPAGLRFQYPPATAHPKDHTGVWLNTFAKHREYFDALKENDCPEVVFRIAVLGLCFGLRKGEILGLDWERIDLENRTISIAQTYILGEGGAYLKEPKTQGSYRIIPMTGFAYEQIPSWSGKRTGAVVLDFEGKRASPATAKRWLQKFYSEHPDIPRVTMHSMRHSFGTSCIKAGIDVKLVSEWMGHTDVSTTYNRYVKPLLEDLQAEVCTIDRAFSS